MLIESAAYQLLIGSQDFSSRPDLADASEVLTSLIGNKVFGGILPGTKDKPFDSYPAVVYRTPPRGGRRVVRILEGGCPLVEQPIHIFSAARAVSTAARIDDAIFHLLDEFRGIVQDPSTSPVESLDVQAVLSTDLSHAYAYVDDLQVHQFVTEFLFHYKDPLRGNPKFI